MKKGIIIKALALGVVAMVALPMTSKAAGVDELATNDRLNHKVCVFGSSLALVAPDGSVDISPIGNLTGVDVMIDGVITKNVSGLTASAGQIKQMILDEDSIIVQNATPESGEAVKKAIQDTYAAGATTIDLSTLTGVTAYKVDESGNVQGADGKTVPSNVTGVSVVSAEEAYGDFIEEVVEIRNEEIAAEAEAKAREAAANAPAKPAAQESEESEKKSGSSVCPVDGTALVQSTEAMYCPSCGGWYEGGVWKTSQPVIIDPDDPNAGGSGTGGTQPGDSGNTGEGASGGSSSTTISE